MFKTAEFVIKGPDADMASVWRAAGDLPIVEARGALSALSWVWPSFPAPSVPRAHLFAGALWGPGDLGDNRTDSAEEAMREAGNCPPEVESLRDYGRAWQEKAWDALAMLGCPEPGDIHPHPFDWARLPSAVVVETPTRRRITFTLGGEIAHVLVDFTGGGERSPSVRAAQDLAYMIGKARVD